MAPPRKKSRDRTSFLIAAVLHIVLIGGVVYWAYKTGKLEQMRQAVLQYVRSEKKEQKSEPQKTPAKSEPPPKLPPINQGMPPASSGSGTRRAVAADAPAAAGGDTFFQDTRRQAEGPSESAQQSAPSRPTVQPRLVAPPPPPSVSSVFKSTAPSTIKALLQERASSAASIESFGSEQIAKSGVSDAGAIVNKVSGATLVEGKFAVIRGLSDRYVTTSFNGAEIPSADPYRRSASLDLFPAQVIDRVVVSKTFTPDQQGSYTGGGVDIVSKSFPARGFVSLSLGGAYNTQATGNSDYLNYEGGSLDWLGMDDGSRAIPDELSDLNVLVPARVDTSGPRASPSYTNDIQNAEKLNALTKTMGTTQFAPEREAPPLNHNAAIAMGETVYLFGRPFGVFGGLNYRREFNFYDDGVSRRYIPSGDGTFRVGKDYSDTLATDVVNWSAIVSLAYRLHEDHDLAFNFLRNQNGQDYTRLQQGTQDNRPTAEFYQNRLQFTERTLTTYQLKGEHRPAPLEGITLNWLAALSNTRQDEPDVRFFNYFNDGGEWRTSSNDLPDPGDPTRYFRLLEENNKNLKADLSIPFRAFSARESFLKTGAFFSGSERDFVERQIFYPDIIGFDGNPNGYLTPDNLGYVDPPATNAPNGRIRYTWMRYIQSFDSTYAANGDIGAVYVMTDLAATERLRLIGGVRLESTDLQVHSESYVENSVTGQRVNDTTLKQDDLLPAVGLIYALRPEMNVRLHYSETIARPSFRELAAYRSYDPVLDTLLDGNPLLSMSAIRNYDLRWEWFPRPGELLSLSFYYKDLTDAIERRFVDLGGDIITFENRPEATVMGVEAEARKTFDFLDPRLRHWSIGGNFSYIASEVELSATEYANKQQYVPDADKTRPLYDQSPYVLNADLSFDHPGWGTSASLILNAAGPRVSIASLTTEDVYEHPPLSLDFTLAQRIGRSMTLKLSARNLLDGEYKRTYGEDSQLLYSSYRRGMTFGVSLTYDF